MDLGCLDLGCISVSDKKGVVDSKNTREDDAIDTAASTNSKIGKNKLLKETGQSTSNTLNRFTSQIKKPPHRKSSPLNWFPRKKVDSYLKRKIKMLQEVDGMNLTLDETLGDSNPHYSRVLREKMAAREAAHKAMEARKAALVEASWCRILRASRIQSKEAEAQLLKAEKSAAEAFEAATAIGVIIYDIPNCPKKPCQIETSSGNGGGSTTHKVTASFETAFEVDIEVAAAVKTALVRLASCASFNKDEFNELLRKISQNPDTGENTQELSEFSSEHESESGSELETASQDDGLSSQEIDSKLPVPEIKQRTKRKRLSFERFNMTKLVEMMLERLRCLQEDELSSLATIVATSGLNAVLAEVQNSKLNDPGSADYSSTAALNFPRRMSSAGAGNLESFTDGHIRRKHAESELPSLDKFLVKHVTKLEREVQEAKNSRRNESREGIDGNSDRSADGKVNLDNNVTSFETIPDLGSILLKHSSKLEKEIEEAKKNSGGDFGMNSKNLHGQRTSSEAVPDLGTILIKRSSKLEKEIEETKRNNGKTIEMKGKKLGGVPEVPSLDKFLVKHVSRLEKEVQEAKNRRKNEPHKEGRVNYKMAKVDSSSVAQFDKTAYSDGGEEKENINLNEIPTISKMEQEERTVDTGEPSLEIGQVNLKAGESLSVQCKKSETKETDNSLDKILVKPVHRLERYKIQALSSGSNFESHCHTKKQPGKSTDCESLDKVLVKHVSRLEKEKMALGLKEEVVKVRGSETKMHSQMNQEGGLDQILVKHKSRLEREKMVAAQQPDDQIRHSVTRREARDKELQEAWGGLSLGNSMRPHQSRLQRDKADWIKAEQEERSKTMKDM